MLTEENESEPSAPRSREERKAARKARVAALEVALRKAEAAIGDLRRQIAEAGKVVRGLSASSNAALKKSAAAIEELRRQAAVNEKLLTRAPLTVPPNAPSFPSPAVSVILPSFNRAGLVGDAIASVLGQTFTDWELIVVDDGSADDTGATIARTFSDPRIRYFAQEHAGASAARNRGIREGRAGLVAFLDSDNLYYPRFLAAAVDAFRADPLLTVGYGALVSKHHDLSGTEILWRPFDRNDLLKTNFIDMNTLVCRKAAVEAVGGFRRIAGRARGLGSSAAPHGDRAGTTASGPRGQLPRDGLDPRAGHDLADRTARCNSPQAPGAAGLKRQRGAPLVAADADRDRLVAELALRTRSPAASPRCGRRTRRASRCFTASRCAAMASLGRRPGLDLDRGCGRRR